jgi:hypothetical protein
MLKRRLSRLFRRSASNFSRAGLAAGFFSAARSYFGPLFVFDASKIKIGSTQKNKGESDEKVYSRYFFVFVGGNDWIGHGSGLDTRRWFHNSREEGNL